MALILLVWAYNFNNKKKVLQTLFIFNIELCGMILRNVKGQDQLRHSLRRAKWTDLLYQILRHVTNLW